MALEKAGSGSVDDADFNALVDALRGVVLTHEFLFTETAGAGTYTAEFDLPADSLVYGFYAKTFAAWADTDLTTLDIGDSDDPGSWGAEVSIGTLDTGWTFQDLAGSHDSVMFSDEGGFYPDGTTLTAVVTAPGETGVGVTRVGFMYMTAPARINAVKS